jgi:ABC-type multidrug transport system ATPase subunit
MELATKKKRKQKDGDGGPRVLLDGSIRGRARPGRMLALMGPSGAGKSTVIHALAGRIKESNKVKLEGLRYINGIPITGDSQVPAAFVEQEVSFFPHMTVRETLAFRVELKLGSLISKHAQEERVEELIQELNLEKAADTIVGDAKVRGISGGERRRLAIACELISSPSVIFLDEPTSGLDSTAATSLVAALRSLADSGKTVIAVIHQPSQHVFAAFDDLLLVSEGKQMYFGEVSKVREYMDRHVMKAPAEMGTAEHILDCISQLELPGESPEDVPVRINRLAELARKQYIDVGVLPASESSSMKRYGGDSHTRRANIFVQFKLLLRRALRENFRSKATLIIKTVQQISLGLIYGTIYNIGMNQASVQDRFGLLSLIAIGSANMAMASTVRAFPKEKAIVANELAAKMYGTLPYFIGKAISEVPLTAIFNSLFGVIVSLLTGLSGTLMKLKRFLGLNSLHGLAAQSAGLMIGKLKVRRNGRLDT